MRCIFNVKSKGDETLTMAYTNPGKKTFALAEEILVYNRTDVKGKIYIFPSINFKASITLMRSASV